jgi:DNA polymerase family A
VIVGFRGVYAVNHPVQGSSAEVMQIALTRLDRALRSAPVQIIATVHDEAVLLVPDDVDYVEYIGAIAKREMIAAFLEVFPDAPTLNLVDPKAGPTWGDLQSLPDWLQSRERVDAADDEQRMVDDEHAAPSRSALSRVSIMIKF